MEKILRYRKALIVNLSVETVPGCSWGTCLPVTDSPACKCSAATFSLRKDEAQTPNESRICAQLCLTHETLEQDRGSSFVVWECKTHTHTHTHKESYAQCTQNSKVTLEAFGFAAFDYIQPAPLLLHSSFWWFSWLTHGIHTSAFPGLPGWL